MKKKRKRKNKDKEYWKQFRNTWDINPVTRYKDNDKRYTRKIKHKNNKYNNM